jgi:hypothetical protein
MIMLIELKGVSFQYHKTYGTSWFEINVLLQFSFIRLSFIFTVSVTEILVHVFDVSNEHILV